MNDKTKITILSLIFGFVSILIIIVGHLAYESFVEENKTSNDKNGTTTRKTVDASEEATTDFLNQEETTTTSSTTTSSTTPIKTSSTTKLNTKTTSKTTKTTVKSTTTATTTKINSGGIVIPIPDEREVTNGATNYPNADDEGAWKIVNKINEERIKNGLNSLYVSVELRNLAEKAADLWYDHFDSDVKEFLYGHSNYRRKSNNLKPESAYLTMYDATIQNTKVTSDKNLRYIGVGLIYHLDESNEIGTYCYVIIYE